MRNGYILWILYIRQVKMIENIKTLPDEILNTILRRKCRKVQ